MVEVDRGSRCPGGRAVGEIGRAISHEDRAHHGGEGLILLQNADAMVVPVQEGGRSVGRELYVDGKVQPRLTTVQAIAVEATLRGAGPGADRAGQRFIAYFLYGRGVLFAGAGQEQQGKQNATYLYF